MTSMAASLVVRVRAAVDDIHHRHRHRVRALAERTVQTPALRVGHRMGIRQRDRQQGIGAETALVVGTVKRNHGVIDACLVGCVHAEQGVTQCAVDVRHGLAHTLAEVTARILVTQFDGLAGAGRGTGGYGGAAHGAAGKRDLGLDGRVAARIDNLAPAYCCYFRHFSTRFS
jgi:hypothetical protein